MGRSWGAGAGDLTFYCQGWGTALIVPGKISTVVMIYARMDGWLMGITNMWKTSAPENLLQRSKLKI